MLLSTLKHFNPNFTKVNFDHLRSRRDIFLRRMQRKALLKIN